MSAAALGDGSVVVGRFELRVGASGDTVLKRAPAPGCQQADLKANGQCTVGVTFTPPGDLGASAELDFTDNGPDSPQFVNLDGTPAAAPEAGVSPDQASFLSDAGAPQPVMVAVQNMGTGPLTVQPASIEGADPQDFTISENQCGGTVGPSEQCTLDVDYSGPAGGSAQATLELPFGNYPSASVPLSASP